MAHSNLKTRQKQHPGKQRAKEPNSRLEAQRELRALNKGDKNEDQTNT